MKISIVIPCFNEEESIARVLESLSKGMGEIIIVDNNSTDSTAGITRRYGAKVVFEPRQGYGNALMTGFKNASYDVIAVLDGDGQYPPDEIPQMVEFMVKNNLDFVSGNRFPLKNKDSMSKVRVFGNRFLTLVANLLFRTRFKDSLSGMWVFKKQILSKMKLDQSGMSFTAEIKMKVVLNPTIRFSEYDIGYHSRMGESKLSPVRDGLKIFFLLVRLRFSK